MSDTYSNDDYFLEALDLDSHVLPDSRYYEIYELDDINKNADGKWSNIRGILHLDTSICQNNHGDMPYYSVYFSDRTFPKRRMKIYIREAVCEELLYTKDKGFIPQQADIILLGYWSRKHFVAIQYFQIDEFPTVD